MTNQPKILIEFTDDEAKWIADHFNDVYWQISSLKIGFDPASDQFKNFKKSKKWRQS